MDELDEYEIKSKANEERNETFLKIFHEDLQKAGLSEKTIRNHMNNADFYLNVYLDRVDVLTMEEGSSGVHLSDFMGYFFIRKCMWSTPATIKSTAASLKKFYKCMLKHGKISQDQYEDVTDTIKFEIDEWQADCAAFNNLDAGNPFNIW